MFEQIFLNISFDLTIQLVRQEVSHSRLFIDTKNPPQKDGFMPFLPFADDSSIDYLTSIENISVELPLKLILNQRNKTLSNNSIMRYVFETTSYQGIKMRLLIGDGGGLNWNYTQTMFRLGFESLGESWHDFGAGNERSFVCQCKIQLPVAISEADHVAPKSNLSSIYRKGEGNIIRYFIN
jgi:hypothetical protein